MNRKLTREALRLLDRHEAFVRATVVDSAGSVPGKVGSAMLLRRDGSTEGTIGGASLEETVRELAAGAFERRRGGLHHFTLQKWSEGGLPSLCGGTVDIAIEYVAPRPNLLLWGGGHVAEAFARLLPPLEYDFSVADDRPDWVAAIRFPAADQRVVSAPGALWDVFEPTAFSHLYVLGYDAAKDTTVVADALARFPNFIGVIASRTKLAHMRQALRDRGCDPTALDRIHSPVGLPIGAQTPAEIAVSMVAELIQDLHPDLRSAPDRNRTSATRAAAGATGPAGAPAPASHRRRRAVRPSANR
jgi:xanthine dehydrogenase accessory factor